jgi:outer membrane biosynthesis protein TonB
MIFSAQGIQMRKLILTAAFLLLSASAQAGSSRSLTLATHEATTEQSAPAQQTAELPKDQPAPQADKMPETKPAEQATAPEPKPSGKTANARPKHKGVSTEARVIYELHRHGIYW